MPSSPVPLPLRKGSDGREDARLVLKFLVLCSRDGPVSILDGPQNQAGKILSGEWPIGSAKSRKQQAHGQAPLGLDLLCADPVRTFPFEQPINFWGYFFGPRQYFYRGRKLTYGTRTNSCIIAWNIFDCESTIVMGHQHFLASLCA
jgi:hypothetical protein